MPEVAELRSLIRWRPLRIDRPKLTLRLNLTPMTKLSILPDERSVALEIYLFQKDRDLSKLPLGRKQKGLLRESFAQDDKRDSIELTDGDRRLLVQRLDVAAKASGSETEMWRMRAVGIYDRCVALRCNRVQLIALGKQQPLSPFCEGFLLASYRFEKYLKEPAECFPEVLLAPGLSEEDHQELQSITEAVSFSRDLINEPLQSLGATDLAERIRTKGTECGFTSEVFSKKKIESLKMGGILAVNRGSLDPPSFSILEWKPEKPINERPIVLVGKGVVYDTGGLSLKPTPGSMDSMKSDMSGAAAVAGAFVLASRQKLPVHLIGLIPATDNRPGVNAYTPGDIIDMYDGSTVEVLNTDAEGRMLLADALSYAKKYDPELVIDLATLTGSAAMAIGTKGLVAMGNAEKKEMDALVESGDKVYERVAVFPFWDDYKDMLRSPIADLKNIGGREAGAITAGKFLEHFTDYPFMHLDIAGPAFLQTKDGYRAQGGTGVGVRLLYQFLKDRK